MVILLLILLLLLLLPPFLRICSQVTSVLPGAVFVSFGDSTQFKESLERIAHEANEMQMFEYVVTLNEHDLPNIDPEFWKSHKAFIARNKRGFGYWIWKPLVILHVMKKYPDRIIVYADSGCKLVPSGRRRMKDYFDTLAKNPDAILQPTVLDFPEKSWTKADLFEALNGNDKYITDTQQIAATAVLLRASRRNIEFIQEWLDTVVSNNYHLVDDTPSVAPNDETFKEHRHDQSVFSVLLKLRRPDAILLSDETYHFTPEYPIHASRIKA